MEIIAVCNQKGGVGKSSVSVNLACTLSQKFKIPLIDIDPQGSASAHLGIHTDAGIEYLLNGDKNLEYVLFTEGNF